MINAEELWLKLRSNPTFVAISGLFFGAVGDIVFEQVQTGKLDLSPAGLHRILVSSAGTAFMAWWHLHRPTPESLSSAPGSQILPSCPLPSPISSASTPQYSPQPQGLNPTSTPVPEIPLSTSPESSTTPVVSPFNPK